ncbi:MAG: Grx4 family monothiol glutaredoxin [Immundisolibacterales bacterium]|nr:Grx4 family monothiol glutaredoxin [Immundisolibacterales bacterium]
MPLDQTVRDRLDGIVGSDRVVLFMKGTPAMPQCGFSATTTSILSTLVPEYTTVNVLEDQEIREGIKAYSEWPTIPQLYIGGEFMGGCDIVRQMFNSGELHDVLDLEPPDRTPPEIHVSDTAANLIRDALSEQPGTAVHLRIDASWQHGFSLGRVEGHEIAAESNGVTIHMDVGTAPRARGLSVDLEESLTGVTLKVDNPNVPSNA